MNVLIISGSREILRVFEKEIKRIEKKIRVTFVLFRNGDAKHSPLRNPRTGRSVSMRTINEPGTILLLHHNGRESAEYMLNTLKERGLAKKRQFVSISGRNPTPHPDGIRRWVPLVLICDELKKIYGKEHAAL